MSSNLGFSKSNLYSFIDSLIFLFCLQDKYQTLTYLFTTTYNKRDQQHLSYFVILFLNKRNEIILF
jgi:hypothetical protein